MRRRLNQFNETAGFLKEFHEELIRHIREGRWKEASEVAEKVRGEALERKVKVPGMWTKHPSIPFLKTHPAQNYDLVNLHLRRLNASQEAFDSMARFVGERVVRIRVSEHPSFSTMNLGDSKRQGEIIGQITAPQREAIAQLLEKGDVGKAIKGMQNTSNLLDELRECLLPRDTRKGLLELGENSKKTVHRLDE